MKKLAIILSILGLLVLMIGCSNLNSPIENEGKSIESPYQRPTFIDTRPAEVIATYIKAAVPTDILEKKPPRPDDGGDTGSTDPNTANNKYAYIVGVSDYEGTQNDLTYCDGDAIDWKNYLQSQGFNVRMDLDRSATSSSIEAGLQWLVNSAQAGDEVVFCYSGHGTSYGQNGSCIISTDLYYLTHDFVMQYLNAAEGIKKLVALDACEIGDFNDNCVSGMVVSTASNTSYSYDGDAGMQNGVWTYYFMKALNNLGYQYAEEATSYAEQNMKSWGRSNHVRVTPTHTDMYTGSLDI